MQLQTSHLGPVTADGIQSYGNPEKFYGTAVVAFIDLLGFSARIRQDWNPSDESALAKLLRIKEAAQGWQGNSIVVCDESIPLKPATIFQSRIHTLSDSLLVTLALADKPQNLPVTDLRYSIAMVLGIAGHIWEQAVLEGFSVRGAIEIGPIYWSLSETIGPAFLDCYEYESELAQWSRVLIGPRLIGAIRSLPPSDDLLTYSLTRSRDGLIELEPGLFRSEERIAQIKKIRDAAPKQLRKKYQPLLEELTPRPARHLVSIDDLTHAKSRIIRRLERKRKLSAWRKFCMLSV
jgi:hypothetical protein